MSLSGPSPVGETEHRSQREIVLQRLREADIPLRRAINLPEGGKRNDHDHTDPENQYPLNEVTGNYGIMGGDGLVVLDIDSHSRQFEGMPNEVDDLPPTFTVQTPHGGEHRYYAIDVDLSSAQLPGIDIQGTGRYVLGPGSALNSCRKEEHDCSEAGEGEYQVQHDRPIVPIGVDDLPNRISDPSEAGETAEERPSPSELKCQNLEVVIAGLDTEYNPLAVFRRMINCAHGRRNRALIEGRYEDAGFGGDRSRAESALVEELGWWFEDDKGIVWTIMDWICQLHPRTKSRQPRKWLERDDAWRDTLFENDWFDSDCRGTYNPRLIREPGDSRPEVSWVCKRLVLEAVCELGAAETKEIEEDSRVDRGLRQVQRALRELREEGLVDRAQRGNSFFHYPAGRKDLLDKRVG